MLIHQGVISGVGFVNMHITLHKAISNLVINENMKTEEYIWCLQMSQKTNIINASNEFKHEN